MGVRPPSDDAEEPDAIEFGIAAVDARVGAAAVTFPATAEEIVRAVEDTDVPYDAHGRSVDLATAIEETGRREFDTEQDLLNALHPVFEEYRSSSVGILRQVRAMLPF